MHSNNICNSYDFNFRKIVVYFQYLFKYTLDSCFFYELQCLSFDSFVVEVSSYIETISMRWDCQLTWNEIGWILQAIITSSLAWFFFLTSRLYSTHCFLPSHNFPLKKDGSFFFLLKHAPLIVCFYSLLNQITNPTKTNLLNLLLISPSLGFASYA